MGQKGMSTTALVERSLIMLPQDYLDTLKLILHEMEYESDYGLRGWKKHVGKRGQDEVLITKEICRRLTKKGFSSTPHKYSCSKICDVVSILPDEMKIWIEVKLYYTFYFEDGDLDYRNPIASHSAGHWKNQIKYLVSDCSTKLLKLLPDGTHIGGLLLGFEMENVPATSCGHNPSSGEVDEYVRSEINVPLPSWIIYPLSDTNGWQRTLSACPQYTFVTKPLLLMPR